MHYKLTTIYNLLPGDIVRFAYDPLTQIPVAEGEFLVLDKTDVRSGPDSAVITLFDLETSKIMTWWIDLDREKVEIISRPT